MTTPRERIAVVYVHGIGMHPRSTVTEHLAVDLARALTRDTRRHEPSDRWERDAVAGIRSADGKVLSAQRLTCVRDDDSLRDGVPQLDVYEVAWSATVRHGRFRWSAMWWMARNVRSMLSVIAVSPFDKALADLAGAVLIALAILVTVAAAAYAALFVAVIAVWFAGAPAPYRINFLGSLAGTLFILAGAKLVWMFLHVRPAGMPSRAVVHARTRTGNPRRRFWQSVYDRAPELTTFGSGLSCAVTASYWFVVVTTIAKVLSEDGRVPRAVAGPVMAVILAIAVVTALLWWFSFLEDKFGDIEVFAAEDPRVYKHVEQRAHIVEHIRSIVAAVTVSSPYQRVVLVAHSLGSALLADYLADDADRAASNDAAAGARLRRVDQVIVYGSPIVAFRRYFSMNASDERRRRENVFAQLVGPGIAARGGTIRVEVLNVWCCGDPISNPFPNELGRCANRKIGGAFAVAHVRYTASREFWTCVLPALLGDGRP